MDPGFEVEIGLRRVGGQMAPLERALRRFTALYAQGQPALRDTSATGREQRWQAACHSVRGACATLGANGLAEGAQQLSERLSAHADEASLVRLAHGLDDGLRELAGRLADELDLAGERLPE